MLVTYGNPKLRDNERLAKLRRAHCGQWSCGLLRRHQGDL